MLLKLVDLQGERHALGERPAADVAGNPAAGPALLPVPLEPPDVHDDLASLARHLEQFALVLDRGVRQHLIEPVGAIVRVAKGALGKII